MDTEGWISMMGDVLVLKAEMKAVKEETEAMYKDMVEAKEEARRLEDEMETMRMDIDAIYDETTS